MTPEARTARLQQCIEAFGSDPTRWPPDASAALAALTETEASALLEPERALDAWLGTLPEPSPRMDLAARILARAPTAREPLLRQIWRALGGLRLAGPAFACALSLGLAFGLLLAPPAPGEADELDLWLDLAWVDTEFEEDLP